MRMHLIKFYNYLDQVIDLKRTLSLFTWIFSVFISIYCLILLSLPLYETSAPKGVVFARDHDGGRAIETSMATRWYNSNHFAAYGNVYYRLSHTLADVISLPDQELAPDDQREKSHNFSLKIVSLFSLYGLCFFIAFIFLGLAPETLLWASVLTVVSLNVNMWATWVFRPHPEHLLSLTLALALYVFGKFLIKPDDRKNFILSALFWGLAMAVKRSTSAFIPGIILFLIFPLNKANTKKTAQYVGYMLLSYLLIGFPQNFGFVKHIKFLLYESSLHGLGGMDTILNGLPLIWQQIWILLPILLFLSFFSSKEEKLFSLKFLLLISLGALPILLRKLSFEGDHHTIPIAISFLMAAIFIFTSFNPLKIQKGKRLILFIAGLALLKFNGIPVSYMNNRNGQLVCRNEINEINEIIGQKASHQFSVVNESIFPSTSKARLYYKSYWGIPWEAITPNVGFIGLNSSSIDEHLGPIPTYFYGKRAENWEAKQKFYRQIKNKEYFSGPHGSYKKIYAKCGFELWEKSP